jgi:transmembrane 9 superfamily protein 2/4
MLQNTKIQNTTKEKAVLFRVDEQFLVVCFQNYKWWSMPFRTGVGLGVYMFGYCVQFYATKLYFQDFSSVVTYFAVSFFLALLACILIGESGLSQ